MHEFAVRAAVGLHSELGAPATLLVQPATAVVELLEAEIGMKKRISSLNHCPVALPS
eukprot:m.320126 g.320126  ORF g.320126 m.320126 type:complete len:57 (+) comp16449_c0_seq2:8146-8316(+)